MQLIDPGVVQLVIPQKLISRRHSQCIQDFLILFLKTLSSRLIYSLTSFFFRYLSELQQQVSVVACYYKT